MALHASIRKVTPPERIIVNGLSTPPSTDTKPSVRATRVLQVFQDIFYHYDFPEYWATYPLSSTEYDQVLDQLDRDERLKGFVEDKVRYDFQPAWGKLIFRMATPIHDTFVFQMVCEIKESLQYLATTEKETQPFIEKIRPGGGRLFVQADNDEPTEMAKHIPDFQFGHADTLWPCIIFEVSNSQKKRDLPYLADDYIIGSNGGIRIMVGLDLDYDGKTKEAAVSVWRLKSSTNEDGQAVIEAEQVVHHQIFRDAQGNPTPSTSASLELSLKDFTGGEMLHVPDYSIVIDAKTLWTILNQAEHEENKVEAQKRSLLHGLQPIKRHRARTPPEQLTVSDEERFTNEERRVRRRLEEQDISYDPESSQ